MPRSTNIDQRLSAFQRNARKNYQGLYAWDFHFDVPLAQDYIIALFLPAKIAIQFVTTVLSAGTLTLDFKIGATPSTGVVITGLSAIAATNAVLSTNFTATDGSNIGTIGQVVLVTASAPAGAADLDFSLVYYRE